jgi:1,4-alpha-glucan branching enzyme
MLKKKPLKSSNKTSVVFEANGFDDASAISLVGDFNDWKPAAHPMKKRKDGAWAVTMRLPNQKRFEYRFVVDGRHWIEDQQADAVVPNPFGGHNSVVILP